MENPFHPILELGWYDGATTGIAATLGGEFHAFAAFWLEQDDASSERLFAFVKCDPVALSNFRSALDKAFLELFSRSILSSGSVEVAEAATVHSEFKSVDQLQVHERDIQDGGGDIEQILINAWNHRR